GARLDLDEARDLVVRVTLDVVQNENLAEGGGQTLEHAMNVRIRLGLRRGHDVVDLDERMAGGGTPPLAITVEGNAGEPRPKHCLAAKGGEARGRTNPGLLQKVAGFRTKWPDESAQHAVDRRRVTAIEADKRSLITLGESSDQDGVDWIVLA